ncbi:MAG: hypothetical protein HUU50_02560 [Candidatus Brocadiae bacterium]|nr:hypothetical protein [Candidatus Brocadiia bacterium]
MIEKKNLPVSSETKRGREKFYNIQEFYEKCILERDKEKKSITLDSARTKLAIEQAKKTKVENQIKKIELAKIKNRLVDITGIQKELDKIMLAFRSKLLSMSARLAVELSMKERIEIEKRMNAAIEEALRELANGKFD